MCLSDFIIYILADYFLLQFYYNRNVTNISSGCLKWRWWQEVVETNNAEEKMEDGFNGE